MDKKNLVSIIALTVTVFLMGWQSEIYTEQTQSVPILNISGEKLKRVKTLVTYGGRVGWSPDGSVIAFDRPGRDGYSDIWLMNPDGSRQRCLTCNNSQLSKNNGNPTWHPSGQYIVFQAEDPKLQGLSQQKLAKYLASPGVAINNNLWVMTADGSQFWQLTHIKDRSGTLFPHFSFDGTKLLWSQADGRRKYNRLGYWTIKLADFSVKSGRPQISNIRTLKPLNFQLYEVHGFSPDNKTILFSGIKENEYYYDMEIYTMELSSGRVRQLTDNDEWDEHAHFTPDGRQIIWPSSKDIPQPKGASLQDIIKNPPKLDYWIMNTDGSDKHRLSGFNDPNASEYLSVPVGIGLGDFDIHPKQKKIIAKLRYGRRNTIVVIELDLP
jgi:Tol biopolymer transport system component